ncbi:MAG TPA: DUF881 domain-containing protein [Candidatus Limnocylindrales bacterium]|jgi:uncharacterized protein YlxW (UPF0749 family)
MRSRRSQLTVTVVAFVLGMLLVAQARSQTTDPGLAALSAQDLTVLIANLDTRNEQLRSEVSTLERELAELADADARGDSSVDAIREDLARVRAWAGLEPVSGGGVRLLIDGPIDGATAEYLLNELRNAGAEALAVGGIRVVPGVVVAGPAGALTVDGRALADPFEIEAIGAPEILTGSLTRIGGPIAQLAATNPDVLVSVSPVDQMGLPASDRDLVPANGRPTL